MNLSKQFEEIEYYCSACATQHKVQIPREFFEGSNFPFSYVYLHGKPQMVTVLYIDKDLQVRGYEITKGMGINKDQLSGILNKSRDNTLKRIPLSSIRAFRLFQNDDIKKMYVQKDFENTISFNAISNMMKNSHIISQKAEKSSDIYMKFDDYWIGAMQFLDFRFIMVVSSEIDIDHFKFQMMNLFETFSAGYKTMEV